MGKTSPPRDASSAVARASSSASRARIATRLPCAQTCRARIKPRPRDPPVMRTTLSLKEKRSRRSEPAITQHKRTKPIPSKMKRIISNRKFNAQRSTSNVEISGAGSLSALINNIAPGSRDPPSRFYECLRLKRATSRAVSRSTVRFLRSARFSRRDLALGDTELGLQLPALPIELENDEGATGYLCFAVEFVDLLS